jgi:putative membrane protein
MLKLLPFLTILALFTACSSRDKESRPKMIEQVSAQPMTDAEISNIVMTADTEGMNLSMVGREKATNPSVRAFAEKMYHDHATHNDKLSMMSENNQIMPLETKSSMEIKSSSEAKVEELKDMQGEEFDKAFMDAQVKMHEDLLQNLTDNLIPNTQNSELLALLQQTRSTVAGHLKEAKAIRASI